jgi:hypothetical protein
MVVAMVERAVGMPKELMLIDGFTTRSSLTSARFPGVHEDSRSELRVLALPINDALESPHGEQRHLSPKVRSVERVNAIELQSGRPLRPMQYIDLDVSVKRDESEEAEVEVETSAQPAVIR